MSVYCSFGIFDGDDGDYPAPLIYRQSNVIPTRDDPRGGYLGLGYIPSFVTRDGYDDKDADRRCWPYLRVSLRGAAEPGEDTVVLAADQVRVLRDELTGWLGRVDENLG